MRKFKRLASMALAAVMTLAMCAPAFATDEPVKVTGYKVYQIFKGGYLDKSDSENTEENNQNNTVEYLSNIKWGQNGQKADGTTVEVDTPVDQDTLDALKAVTNGSNGEKLAVISKYVNKDNLYTKEGFNGRVTADSDGKATVNGVEPGYYLVEAEYDGTPETTMPYLVNVTDGTLEIKPKTVGVPDIDKEIVIGEKGADDAGVTFGSVLTYKLTGGMPANIDDYKSYYYVFTDIMDAGLEYIENSENPDELIKVTLDGTPINDNIYVGATEGTGDNAGKTVLTVGTNNLKALAEECGINLNANSKIIVTYCARVKDSADVNNSNKVTVSYPNNPNTVGDGEPNDPNTPPSIPEDSPKTVSSESNAYITGLTVTVLAENVAVEEGKASFELEGENLKVVLEYDLEFTEDDAGEWYQITTDEGIRYTNKEPENYTGAKYSCAKNPVKIVDSLNPKKKWDETFIEGNAGQVIFKGLNAGEYTLKQLTSPDGYNLHEDITFTIGFNKTDKFYCIDNPSVREQNEWFFITINQGLGTLLPETGGIGTTLLYIGGILLIAVAGAAFILKGKKEEETA